MRIRTGPVVLAVLAVLLASCGSAGPTGEPDGPASSAGATTPAGAEATPRGAVAFPAEPCSLVTQDDLMTQFGVDFPPAEIAPSGETRTDCIWDPKVLDSGATVGPVVMTVMGVNEGQWDIGRAQAGATLVPGVGDDAYFSPLVMGALEARVGNVHLRFSAGSTSESNAAAGTSLVALAVLAASRL